MARTRAFRPALLIAALALGVAAAPLAAQTTAVAMAPAWKEWTPWKLWQRWTSGGGLGLWESWARWRESKEWKEFDVNRDGAFDREDMNEIMGVTPWQYSPPAAPVERDQSPLVTALARAGISQSEFQDLYSALLMASVDTPDSNQTTRKNNVEVYRRHAGTLNPLIAELRAMR